MESKNHSGAVAPTQDSMVRPSGPDLETRPTENIARNIDADLRRRVRRTLAMISIGLNAAILLSVIWTREPVPLPGGHLLIDINTASAQELSILPQVGPVLARRIVHDRHRLGQFVNVGDLVRVHGIGPSTLEKIRPYCVVGNQNGDAKNGQLQPSRTPFTGQPR